MKVKTVEMLRKNGEDVTIVALKAILEDADATPGERRDAMTKISKLEANAAIEAARRSHHPEGKPRYRFHKGARVRVG